jgi:hypothetical protein
MLPLFKENSNTKFHTNPVSFDLATAVRSSPTKTEAKIVARLEYVLQRGVRLQVAASSVNRYNQNRGTDGHEGQVPLHHNCMRQFLDSARICSTGQSDRRAT